MIVKKFGGVTVDSPEKILAISAKISEDLKQHKKMIIVVSAMGSTTNQLISLAHQITPHPNLRELDMLLTTGERISASLLTMALCDLNIKATSLTGSQASIITDENHFNAHIREIKPYRILQLLNEYQVIVLAGFQGVSEQTKNITTLGRGGSDTTAIAIAAALKADACHIIKEVTHVYSADPKIVPQAKPLRLLDFSLISSMTYWGAKVLHYRSVKLAQRYQIPIYIGSSSEKNPEEGTWIKSLQEYHMFEQSQFFAITSFKEALKIRWPYSSVIKGQKEFLHWLKKYQIIDPQIIFIQLENQVCFIYLTASKEVLDQIKFSFQQEGLSSQLYSGSSVSLHGGPITSSDFQEKVTSAVEPYSHLIYNVFFADQGVHFYIDSSIHNEFVAHLHKQLIEKSNISK